jgi:hypothetical protein
MNCVVIATPNGTFLCQTVLADPFDLGTILRSQKKKTITAASTYWEGQIPEAIPIILVRSRGLMDIVNELGRIMGFQPASIGYLLYVKNALSHGKRSSPTQHCLALRTSLACDVHLGL